MKLLFDLHTHTLASGHAYSTLLENVHCAKEAGLLAYGFSDHAEKMPGSCSNMFFANFRVIPDAIEGVRVVKGCEANLLDLEGNYDLPERIAQKLDYVIVSMHIPCFTSGTREENTEAFIKAMHSPYVKIIGHPDDSRYPLDMERLVLAAKKYGVLLELNNTSLKTNCPRVDGYTNAKEMLRLCKKHKVRIIVDTDSHICFDIGKFTEAEKLLQETQFPEELVANVSLDRLDWVLHSRAEISE